MKINEIDNYKIDRLLGIGSMGKVYLAREKQGDNLFAIKILKENLTTSREEAILRFKREAEIVKGLSHPSIIKLYSVSLSDNFYIIMEYFPGANLRHFYTNLNLYKKIEIIKQCADALNYIHTNGVIHQDLKPENILLKNNQESEIRIIDFGLSHFINLQDSINKNLLIGSLGYISPEQTGLLKRNIDNRSDLYSLGVIFYEFVTGRLPFQDTDIGNLLYRHLAEIPVKPSEHNKEIPDMVDKIILKLLSKDPNDRYQFAAGLISDLEKFLNNKENNFLIGQMDVLTKPNFQIKPIGLEKELNILNKKFSETNKSNPSINLIYGESGSGKSFLVDALKETSFDENTLFLSFKCSQSTNNIPYLPISEILKTYFEKYYSNDNAKFIGDSVGDRAGLLLTLFPFLNKVLKKTKTGDNWILEGPALTQELFTGIIELIKSLGKLDKKIVLFIDDIQWADKDSLILFNYLSVSLSNTKLLLLLTAREEDYTNLNIEQMSKSIIFSSLKINPVEPSVLNEFLSRILNTQKKFSAALYEKIYENSKGNPLAIIEIIKTLFFNEIIYSENFEWKIDYNKLENFTFESGIEQLLLDRLSKLDEDELNVLSIISIIGKEFNLDLLSELMSADKKNMEQLISVIDKGLKQQIIMEDLSKEKGTYYFTHDKITETLYNRLVENDKKHLHLICAKNYENKFNSGRHEAVFSTAFHYNNTLETEKILYFNDIAFKQAISYYSTSQAIYYLKIIVDFNLDNQLMVREKIQLIMILATLLQFDGNLPLSLEYLEKGLNLSKSKAWHEEEINFLLNIGASYCWIQQREKAWEYLSAGFTIADKYKIFLKEENTFRSIGLVMLNFRNLHLGITFLTKILKNIDKKNYIAMLYTYAARACSYCYTCEFEKALTDLKKIENLLPKIDNQIFLSEIYHVISWAYSFILQDKNKHALMHSIKAGELAEKINHKIIIWATYSTKQTMNYFQNKFDKTLEMVEEQNLLSKKFQIAFFSDSKYGFTSSCYLWNGEMEKAESFINDMNQNKIEILDIVPLALLYKVKAVLSYIKDDLEECLKILNQAHDIYKENGILLFNHFNLYFRVLILKMLGKNQESEEAYLEFKQILIDKPGQEFYLLRVFELIEIAENARENFLANISQHRPVRDSLALRNIINTAQSISSILDLDKLITYVLEKALQLTGASRGALLLYNEETNQLELKSAININANNDEFKVPQKIITKTEEKKQGIVLCFSDDGEIFNSSDSIMTQAIRSVLCIPVEYKGKIMGLLYMDSLLLDKLFTKTHLNLLKVFTAQVAVSIDNARAYQLIERERNLLDATVQEKTKELENFLKMKDHFIAIANHDLKNVFSAIHGSSLWLLNENLSEMHKKIVKIIYRSSNNMMRLADHLLKIALIEQEKISLNRCKTDIIVLIEDVSSAYDSIREKKDISINFNRADQIFVLIDPEKIYMVLGNLLHNAIKFTPKKGIIEINVEKDYENLKIKIFNSGKPISDELIQGIFDPYSRSPITHISGKKKGTGVGLMICKKMVELHQGEIGVTTIKGKGNEFWFTLPCGIF